MAVLLAFASSVLWGGSDFFGGLMAKRRPVYAVVGGSQAAGLIAVTIAAMSTHSFGGSHAWVKWSMLAGIIGVLGLLMFYSALSRGTMGVVSPIAALGAVVPVVVGFAGGEKPGVLAIAGIVIGLAGAFAASGPEIRGAATSALPVVLGALSGLCFGTCFVFIAFGAETNPMMTLVGMRATSVGGFLVAAVLLRSIGGLQVRDAPSLVGIGLADAGANLLYALASQLGFLSITSVIGSLYPVATVVLAYVILHERLRSVQVVGVVAALIGVALVSVG